MQYRIHIPIFLAIGAIHTYILYVNMILLKSGWILGDYMINFEDGGFKRRGISGSLFLLLNSLTGIKLEYLAFGFHFIALFTLLYLLHVQLLQCHDHYYKPMLALLLTPFTLLFATNDFASIGKKEFLFYLALILFIHIIRSRKAHFLIITGSTFLFLFTALWHEAIFFYLPYFLFAIRSQKDTSQKLNYQHAAILTGSATLLALVIRFFGKKINEGKSMDILQKAGLTITDEGIFDSQWNQFDILTEYGDAPGALSFMIIFTLTVMLLGYLIFRYVNLKLQLIPAKSFNLLLGIAMLTSGLLFYLAMDWGRWVSIHFNLLAILMLFSVPAKGHPAPTASVSRVFYVLLLVLALFKIPFISPQALSDLHEPFNHILKATLKRL